MPDGKAIQVARVPPAVHYVPVDIDGCAVNVKDPATAPAPASVPAGIPPGAERHSGAKREQAARYYCAS